MKDVVYIKISETHGHLCTTLPFLYNVLNWVKSYIMKYEV